jgi:hypothetical protein
MKLQKKGDGHLFPADKKAYKKGTSSPAIALIKRHLQITGDMPGADTSQVLMTH